MNIESTAIRWYEKARSSNDSYDKFISVWISFNAIYGQVNEQYERDKIRTTIKRLSDESVHSIITLSEVNYFIEIDPPISGSTFTTANFQEKLRRYNTRSPREGLINLIFILNTVRNNLFHGSKDINHSRDVGIVTNAYPIVSKLVEEYLRIDSRESNNEQQSFESKSHSVSMTLLNF